MHHRNIQILATELYKVVNGLLPDIMKDDFPLNNNLLYNTRNRRTSHSRSIRSFKVKYGKLDQRKTQLECYKDILLTGNWYKIS